MKKVFALIFLIAVIFIGLMRQRIYVWDPLASVTRDGLKVEQARTMINYSNDLLLQDRSDGRRRVYLVQGWNRKAAAPAILRCLQWVGCMTDADQASASPIQEGTRGRRTPFEGVTMTNRRVEFVDEDGALVVVILR